jgi:phosphoglycerate dehydrogenase-like enzyme
MTRIRLLLDIPADQEEPLFAADLLDRLERVARVTRGRARPWLGDARLDADVLVTGWGSDLLPEVRGDGRLQLIVHSAGTIKKIVPRALLADGVRLTQASQTMARSVAELALFSTLSLLRHLHPVDRRMRDRDWAGASSFGLGSTVDGTTVGVVGASRVGRIYIDLAKALGAEVSVYDPYLDEVEASALGARLTSLDDVLSTNRVVAVHAPVTDETRGFLSAEKLALLADGTALVNTARSALFDSAALERELVSGRIDAALDVFDVEPLPADSPLWSLPNVALTPHLGAVTTQSRRSQGVFVVEEIERFVRGEPLAGEVIAASYDRLA